MPRDLSYRKQEMTHKYVDGLIQDFKQTLAAEPLFDTKIYVLRHCLPYKITDPSEYCSVLPIEEYHWICKGKSGSFYGLAKNKVGYIYFRFYTDPTKQTIPVLKLTIDQSRENLVNCAMSDHIYKYYILDTQQYLEVKVI
jgi:hypothetical protein